MKLSLAPAPLISVLRLFLSMLIFQSIGPGKAFAQSYNYIHYRSEQGFKATNAYCLFQDSKGYIWIGTENGVMRFNGRDFKLYTTRDGLPDNEVFVIKEDARGKLWMLPFVNAVCYIQNGQLFTAENDPVLRKLDLKTRQTNIYFDRFGITWFYDAVGQFTGIDTAGNIKRAAVGMRASFSWLNAGGQVMAIGQGWKIFELSDKGIEQVGMLDERDCTGFFCGTKDVIYEAGSGRIYHYEMRGKRIHFLNVVPGRSLFLSSLFNAERLSDRELYIRRGTTSYVVDMYTGKIRDSFCVGNQMAACMWARDSTLWGGTIGGGIIHFLNSPVRTVSTIVDKPCVLYIKGTDDGMYCTTDRSCFLSARYGPDSVMRQDHIVPFEKGKTGIRYLYIGRNKQKDWILCGAGANLIHKPGSAFVKRYYTSHSIKAVQEEDEDHLLMASIQGVFRMDRNRFRPLDTFLNDKRTTVLAKLDTVIYAGTLNGLYAAYPDKRSVQVLEGNPYLKGHIVAMDTGPGKSLWVANNKAVLLELKDGRICSVLDLQQKQQCNSIICLRTSHRFIWVGTDKGLFALDIKPPHKMVRHLTYVTGLSNNQVNCLDMHKGRVWVGTAGGINYFDEDDISRAKDSIEIIINSIRNGEKFLVRSRNLLRLENKPLIIDFDVVDFSGGARPAFEYRINDKGPWATLEGTQLYFPVLPSGRFKLTLRASSSNWRDGAVFLQEFYNPPPYYLTWWFILLTILAGLIVAGYMVYLILKKVRRRNRNKIAVQQNLLRLEQMALQGQLNPHFIFNCITAIKQRYGSGNTEAADRFVDSFSSLIRQTFEMGAETFVSLDRELSYLDRYLEVEAARFNHSFRYRILRETTTAAIPVPAMLLQPVVENAIRHGIRHLPDGAGEIIIHISEAQGHVVFLVNDNGIGMKRSEELKGQHSRQLLTSSTVNSKRIRILNQLLPDKISMRMENLPEGGTCVIISYPVNINQHIIS